MPSIKRPCNKCVLTEKLTGADSTQTWLILVYKRSDEKENKEEAAFQYERDWILMQENYNSRRLRMKCDGEYLLCKLLNYDSWLQAAPA